MSAKIEAIKAEREKTANVLKRYEEELERRKLGVPLEHFIEANVVGYYTYCFASEKSMRVFDGRFAEYVEALQKLAKGEPISIQVLIPLLKKGWVAMEKNGNWFWYSEKPCISNAYFCWNRGGRASFIGGFNIKPAENWENSLMECGL